MMAPRKDMMRIIRQDAGFSAKLGFGGFAAAGPKNETPDEVNLASGDAVPMLKPAVPAVETIGQASSIEADLDTPRHYSQVESRKEEVSRGALLKSEILPVD